MTQHTRAFGRTGWSVSEIGFGAWAIGGSWGAYWYNGLIYSSEMARGLDILELVPTGYERGQFLAGVFGEILLADAPIVLADEFLNVERIAAFFQSAGGLSNTLDQFLARGRDRCCHDGYKVGC